jgi:hypothetical protein
MYKFRAWDVKKLLLLLRDIVASELSMSSTFKMNESLTHEVYIEVHYIKKNCQIFI